MNYKNKHFKILEKEDENQFNDYRDVIEDEKQKYKKEKLSQLPVHQLIKQIKLYELLWDFDAVSLYPSAMLDEKSNYPRIETAYVYTDDINDELVEKFNTANFTERSAIVKIKYYNPKNLIVQHLQVKERENIIAINRIRNGYIIDTLISVDNQESVKIGAKVVEVFEGVIIERNLKHLVLEI